MKCVGQLIYEDAIATHIGLPFQNRDILTTWLWELFHISKEGPRKLCDLGNVA